MTNIFRSIGNAFKAGWNNGNIAKGVKIAGMAAMGGAVVSAAIDDMKHANRCCHDRSIFNGFMGGRAYNFGSMNFNQSMMFNSGYGNYYSDYGMLNSYMGNDNYYSNYTGYDGYNYSGMLNSLSNRYADPSYWLNNIDLNNTEKEEMPAAKYESKAADAQVDGTAAENMQNALSKLLDSKGKATDQEAYTFTEAEDRNGGNETEKYKTRLANIGNSMVAFMDSNGDHFVSLEEYKAATNNENADIAFKKLDANHDGKLDFREFGAQVATFDADTSNAMKKNGQISATDYEHWNRALHDENGMGFDRQYRQNLKNYFDLE